MDVVYFSIIPTFEPSRYCKCWIVCFHYTNVDKSIDLKSYIASAQKTNQKIIDNAGTQINAKTSEYMSTGKAFRGDSYEDL